MVYIWKEKNPVQVKYFSFRDRNQSIDNQIGNGISLPRFVIEKYSSDYCNVKTSTGSALIGAFIFYSTIEVELQKIKFCLFHKLFKVTFNDFIVIVPSLDFGSIELRKLVTNMIYELFYRLGESE